MSQMDEPVNAEPIPRPIAEFDAQRLEAFFDGGRDEALVAYAYDLVDARFAAVGLKANQPEPGSRHLTSRWQEFCWYLFHALYDPIYRQNRDALATAVLADLVAFCLQSGQAPPGSQDRAYRFAIILSVFQERDVFDERLIALLPPEIQAELPGIRAVFEHWAQRAAEWEEELFRMGQHGY